MVVYVPRIADGIITQRLRSSGAVVLEGPKACGKTETASQFAASVVRLDVDASARQMAQVAPERLLHGDRPRLIDEWQEFPAVWNHVRRAVDDRDDAGQFLLAGSSVPNDDVPRHSGAGRFATVRMRPMAVAEAGQSSRQVSLTSLFEGDPPSGTSQLDLEGVLDLLVLGGWPAQLRRPDPGFAAAYVEQTVEMDVQRIGNRSRRDPTRVRALLSSLARNTATDVKVTTLARDTGEQGLSRDTVLDYLDALRRIMVLDEQPAWRPHLRSSAHLRQSPKYHLADPSLAIAALGADHDALIADLELTGLLFESMVVRDLRVLALPLGGAVSHLRTTQGHEIDAAVQLPDGRWGAVEVKLGGDELVAAGVDSLKRALAQLDTARTLAPSFRAVVTATGNYAYRRQDGIDIIPLGSLAP